MSVDVVYFFALYFDGISHSECAPYFVPSMSLFHPYPLCAVDRVLNEVMFYLGARSLKESKVQCQLNVVPIT